jgi:hypothetical protein
MYVQWATLLKRASLEGCLKLAENTLIAQNLQVLKGAEGADYLVVGGNSDVTMTIVCVPQATGVWIVVSASSGDAAFASQACDLTREMIDATAVA